MRNIFFVLFLLVCFHANGQEFDRLMTVGDSLRKASNNKEAFNAYHKAIDLVLSNKIQVYDFQWLDLLNRAGETNDEDVDIDLWRMAYGTRAEKISEKIRDLKFMGVRYIFSYEIQFPGAAATFKANSCVSSQTKFLVWGINNEIFMQKFNDCDTYKPLRMHDRKLYVFFKLHFKDIINEKTKKILTGRADHMEEYQFEFCIGNKALKKEWVAEMDFANPTKKYPNVFKPDLEAYKHNVQSYFGKFFLQVISDENKYYRFINSGAERAKVGSIE